MADTLIGPLLAEQIRAAHALLARYFGGFTDEMRTRQAANLPNHAAWSLGHLAITLHRAAERFGEQTGLPESDFISGDGGDEGRFGTESVSFGSTPSDDPARYPTWQRCREILAAAVERAARALENLPDDELNAEVQWGAGKSTRRQLALRQIFHLGTHCGQLADLRRALGMGSIFGK